MVIVNPAVAGTLESSDVQVTVEPGEGDVVIDLSSSVMNRYGRRILEVVRETLDRLEVRSGRFTVVDRGALDATIKARVECAVFRANGQTDAVPWGGSVR
jgi:citrate lyase acyl carrier protein